MDYVNAQGDIYPLDTSYADVSLNDIVRRNQEQIEADNLRRKEENIANWIVTSMEVISQGKNPFAKIYASGHVIDHAPISRMSQESINYWAGLTEYKSDIHEAVSNLCKPNAIYIPANANKHLGSVGDKVTVKAMIIYQDTFESDYGYGSYIRKVKYVTENGERLVTKGADTTKFNQAIFQETDDQLHVWVELEATIKNHNEFTPEDSDKTWNTTSLIRPKLIKVFGQDREVA
jgi:hypothetical protein